MFFSVYPSYPSLSFTLPLLHMVLRTSSLRLAYPLAANIQSRQQNKVPMHIEVSKAKVVPAGAKGVIAQIGGPNKDTPY